MLFRNWIFFQMFFFWKKKSLSCQVTVGKKRTTSPAPRRGRGFHGQKLHGNEKNLMSVDGVVDKSPLERSCIHPQRRRRREIATASRPSEKGAPVESEALREWKRVRGTEKKKWKMGKGEKAVEAGTTQDSEILEF